MTELADSLLPYRLYRYFDIMKRLLYVGVTGDLAVRDGGHISRSRWMQLVARSSAEPYPDRESVLEVERTAIETEHPLFNLQYNNTAEARARVRAYLGEVGRMDLYVPRPLSLHMPPGELEMIKARKAKPKPRAEADLTEGDIVRRPMGRDEVVLMCVAVLQDARLSLAARGLLALVISLPDRETTTEWLAERVPGGEEAIQGALSELEACGYCRDGVICDEPQEDAASWTAGRWSTS
jgi:hypothetical protein